jgi:hypothetical protein
MHHLRTVAVSTACLLAACGGGGDQGGDFGSGLSIDKTTLSFSGTANEAGPPAQTVLATITATDAATVALGYTGGNEKVPWLQATATTQAGSNVATVSISVNVLLIPGTYTAHPAVAIFRSDGTPIAVRGLTVTYQVLPQTPSVSTNTVALTMQSSLGFAPHQQILVKGTGTWTATVDYASGSGWLVVGGSNTFPQTGPGGTFVDLSAVPTTPVGPYSATLHFAIGGQTLNVAVTLDVQP